MTQTKLWVMVCEPHREAYTKSVQGMTIEDCIRKLDAYLDKHTPPGTTVDFLEAGYVPAGRVTHGI